MPPVETNTVSSSFLQPQQTTWSLCRTKGTGSLLFCSSTLGKALDRGGETYVNTGKKIFAKTLSKYSE